MKYIKLDSKKSAYYMSLALVIIGVILMALPPYSWRAELGMGAFVMLLIEVTRYRYYNWKPEKSPHFSNLVGCAVKMIIDAERIVVHQDGQDVKRYAVKLEEIKDDNDGSTENSTPNEK